MDHTYFISIAIKEARLGMDKNHGGPFGAVIVKNGKIIAKAHNHVLINNDPTAHGEIYAIRDACKKLKSFKLFDCILYTNCEPCPMCLAAIEWSGIKEIVYCLTRDNAEEIGFSDKRIYKIIQGKIKGVPKHSVSDKEALKLFSDWKKKLDKRMY